MPTEEVHEILLKYKNEEARINQLLEQKQTEEKQITTVHLKSEEGGACLNMDEAAKRNDAILKNLEIVKGNLRSKAIYSPSEIQWENISARYRQAPSLPVTTWRCHLPVFV